MTSNLISKNIDNYFNELIKKPITIIPKKPSSINIFYKNYIEHNLLLIFIIIFISIFLLFKYYSKENDDDNIIDYEKEKKITISKNDNIKKINKLKRKKEQLAKEKNEILSIIDELSELNFEKSQNINNSIDNNINNNKNCSKETTYDDVNEETISNYIDDEIIKIDAYKNNNLKSEDYYNITEKNSELINGIYFETPYN
jgi:hypothetical protein